MDIITLGALVTGLVSTTVAVTSLYLGRQERKRQLVADVWSALISTDAMQARRVIGHAARAQLLSSEQKSDFIDAAFRLLWELQRIDMAISVLRGKSQDKVEAIWLLRQVDVIYPDLKDAIAKHGAGVDWQPTLNYTNEVLANISNKVKDHEKERSFVAFKEPPS